MISDKERKRREQEREGIWSLSYVRRSGERKPTLINQLSPRHQYNNQSLLLLGSTSIKENESYVLKGEMQINPKEEQQALAKA